MQKIPNAKNRGKFDIREKYPQNRVFSQDFLSKKVFGHAGSNGVARLDAGSSILAVSAHAQ